MCKDHKCGYLDAAKECKKICTSNTPRIGFRYWPTNNKLQKKTIIKLYFELCNHCSGFFVFFLICFLPFSHFMLYSYISTGIFLTISSKCLSVLMHNSTFDNSGRNKLRGFCFLNSSGNPKSAGTRGFPTKAW